MGIFDSMENMFDKEQIKENVEHKDVLPEQAEPAGETVESGEVSFKGAEMEKERMLGSLRSEYSAFGNSARFRGMLDRAGMSREDFNEYYYGKRSGMGHMQKSPFAEDAAFKAAQEKTDPSFKGRTLESFQDEADVKFARQELEDAIRSGDHERIDEAADQLTETVSQVEAKDAPYNVSFGSDVRFAKSALDRAVASGNSIRIKNAQDTLTKAYAEEAAKKAR